MKINLLETCRFGLDGGAMFGVVPKTLWERAYTNADDRNRIPMAAKVMLIRTGDRVVLVDTGNCPWMQPKLQEIYGITFNTFTLERSLAAHGVTPDDVTDVILTHLHFDHVGGAVLENGEPRFANARHYVQREHYAWACNPSEKDRASFIQEMFQPLFERGLVDFTEGDGEILPNVRVEAVYGHTVAMQAVVVNAPDTTYFYPADLMPTSAHVPVPYVMGYDNQPLVSISEKKRYLPRIIEEGWTVIFEHDALRDAATIEMGPKGPVLGSSVSLV